MTTIHLTGTERVRTEPHGPLRRLDSLDRWDVLGMANYFALSRERDLADALYRWQHALLRRELAAPRGPGGHAA